MNDQHILLVFLKPEVVSAKSPKCAEVKVGPLSTLQLR